MELVASSNNILADYNGNKDEEQMENEEMEEEDFEKEEMDEEAENDENMEQIEEEEDEEPDFMDNSGKLWKFECRIENVEHLEDWCRRMGGMRRGKEEKFTRQFDCPADKCQFKVIFLKSLSILYSRNVHNHEVENMEILVENNEKDLADKESNKKLEAAGEDYVDIFGKVWKFYKQIDKDISHKTLCNKFGFNFVRNRQSTLNLYCRKYGKNWKCKFAGIYLKENGCLYIRGQHEHILKAKKTAPKVGEDYIDRFGKVWAFNEQIGIGVPQKTFRRKFGFTNIKGMQKIFMYCRRNGPKGRCKFAGIYLKKNGCLYTRGEHEHMGLKIKMLKFIK